MAERILMVDDDSVILFVQKRNLIRNGFSGEIIQFQNGRELLDFLKSEKNAEPNTLVLLDIRMPEMDGWTFLDVVQNHNLATELSVYMVSSSVDISDREKASQYDQVIGYIEKPLDDAKCKQLIEKADEL
jgi:CheY-like chemotaxis protein